MGPRARLLQGGCHGDPKRLLPPIAHEPTTQTGLRHRIGTLSMPRRELGTADGEFFICLEEAPWYDVNPIKPGDNLGYAAFGQVAICDVRLPHAASGLELAIALREAGKKVLLISGETHTSLREAAQRHRLSLLIKPVSSAQLLTALQQL
eukprot:gene49772-biopygen40605